MMNGWDERGDHEENDDDFLAAALAYPLDAQPEPTFAEEEGVTSRTIPTISYSLPSGEYDGDIRGGESDEEILEGEKADVVEEEADEVYKNESPLNSPQPTPPTSDTHITSSPLSKRI
jgi:hypothetical protein